MTALKIGWLVVATCWVLTLALFVFITKSAAAAGVFSIPILLSSAATTHWLRKNLDTTKTEYWEATAVFSVIWTIYCFGGFVLWSIIAAPSP